MPIVCQPGATLPPRVAVYRLSCRCDKSFFIPMWKTAVGWQKCRAFPDVSATEIPRKTHCGMFKTQSIPGSRQPKRAGPRFRPSDWTCSFVFCRERMGQHLPVIPASEAVRAFTRAGYVVLPGRGKGSHTVVRHSQTGRILTIPRHDPVRRGTLRAIIRQAGMTVEEFRKLL